MCAISIPLIFSWIPRLSRAMKNFPSLLSASRELWLTRFRTQPPRLGSAPNILLKQSTEVSLFGTFWNLDFPRHFNLINPCEKCRTTREPTYKRFRWVFTRKLSMNRNNDISFTLKSFIVLIKNRRLITARGDKTSQLTLYQWAFQWCRHLRTSLGDKKITVSWLKHIEWGLENVENGCLSKRP